MGKPKTTAKKKGYNLRYFILFCVILTLAGLVEMIFNLQLGIIRLSLISLLPTGIIGVMEGWK